MEEIVDSDEVLIGLIRNKPILWNSQLPGYKQKTRKENAIMEIAQQLKLTNTQVQARWKNLRNRFGKELRESKKKKSGDAGQKLTKPWIYFEMMTFLADHIKSRNTFGNEPVNEPVNEPAEKEKENDQEQIEQVNNQDEAEKENVDYENHDDISSPSQLYESPSCSFHSECGDNVIEKNMFSFKSTNSGRQTSNPRGVLTTQQDILDTIKSTADAILKRQQPTPINDVQQEDRSFCASLVGPLSSLHPRKKLKVKRDIMNLLVDCYEDEANV